jgi:sugar phosphate isomerase/epimerase
MKNPLSVSHIAWPPEREEEMIDLLVGAGVSVIELAPLRAFGNPLLATEAAVRAKAGNYAKRGIRIGSFQALLFGAEAVFLFEDEASRTRMKDWLIAVGRVAGWCGAGPMVFGSPKNRLKGELSHSEAIESAAPFFREVGGACAAAGSFLVMEANPEAYGADFCTRMEQAAELVSLVDSPGFKLHVDAGGLALSGEEFEPVVRQAAKWVAHAHASQPNLIDWATPHPVHKRIAAVLHEIDYSADVAIEMRATEPFKDSVKTAIEKVTSIYQKS